MVDIYAIGILQDYKVIVGLVYCCLGFLGNRTEFVFLLYLLLEE